MRSEVVAILKETRPEVGFKNENALIEAKSLIR
jgi:hypothetical protein